MSMYEYLRLAHFRFESWHRYNTAPEPEHLAKLIGVNTRNFHYCRHVFGTRSPCITAPAPDKQSENVHYEYGIFTAFQRP